MKYSNRIPFTRKLAKELLAKHSLFDWHFKIDRSRRVAGRCYFDTKTISVSGRFIREIAQSEREIRYIILHEIAHALTGEYEHNDVWAARCVYIGGDGRQFFDMERSEAP